MIKKIIYILLDKLASIDRWQTKLSKEIYIEKFRFCVPDDFILFRSR